MNLFASFAANNLLWLLWYGTVLGNPQVIQRNDVSYGPCKTEIFIFIPRPFHSIHLAGWLCSPPPDPALLPADQLRVDAVRGLLPAHGPRVRLRVREAAGAVPSVAGLGCPGCRHSAVRPAEGLPRRRVGHDSVSTQATALARPITRPYNLLMAINRRPLLLLF